MKVLVTGGAGFIGSHITDLLTEHGHDVIIIDNLSTGSIKKVSKHACFYQVDINSDLTEEIIKKEKPDYVIHTAAQINVTRSIQDPQEDARINILGTIRLLDYAKKYGIKKVIFSSSSAVYGETEDINILEDHQSTPISFYGASKLASEFYIKLYSQLHNVPYTILRYSNVYGPRQTHEGEGGVVATFCHLILNQQSPFIYGDGNQTRDFVYVKDVARANLASLELGDNKTINIGTSSKTSIKKLFTLLNELTKSNVIPIFKLKRDGDIQHSCLNNERAKEVLNWKPMYTLTNGLKETLNYYKGVQEMNENDNDVK